MSMKIQKFYSKEKNLFSMLLIDLMIEQLIKL